MEKDLVEAKRTREDEKAAFEAGLADDEKAAELIKKAKEVLKWEAKRGVDEMCADAWRWQKQNPEVSRCLP